MSKITNFSEAHEVLAEYVPRTSQLGSYKLDRMRKLMDKLGNPQNSYKVIHVAGTSGKTSTSYYIAALLQQSRRKVGLTVSPHVDDVNERIQINLEPLPEAKFCSQLSHFLSLINDIEVKPTYFELLIAFAYWQFAQEGVDYAVIEVGLGGLLDGTNVIGREDKVCVITDIGFDHTHILGKTLPEIAAQKAGIIQDRNVVFMYAQDHEIMDVVRKRCTEKGAMLHEISHSLSSDGVLPLFQQHNWYLARQASEFVMKRDGLGTLAEEQLKQTRQTYIPARMEVIKYDGKTVVLDGAHNPQKIGTLIESLQVAFPGEKFAVVLGLLSDKELGGVIKELKPVTKDIYATAFRAEQDMPRSAINPNEIIKVAKGAGMEGIVVEIPEEAFNQALQSSADIVLVTGSFFLLNHIRPLIFNRP